MARPVDRTVLWAGVLAAFGAAVLTVTTAHIWMDIQQSRNLVYSALENVLPVLFSVVVVAVGAWLLSTDWDARYARTVSLWTLGAAVALLILHGYVLWTRSLANHTFSPLILGATTLVVGATLGLGVGVYSAQLERERESFAAERDQFSALVENTTDGVVLVEFVDDEPVIRDANAAFEGQFGYASADITGDSLADLVVPENEDAVIPDHTRASSTLTRLAQAGEEVESEVRRRTTDGLRDFVVRVIPLERDDTDRAYVVYTDITEEKRLHRAVAERERVEYLHEVATDFAELTDRETLYDRALAAADEAVDFTSAALVVDGDVVATRNADAPTDWDAIASAGEDAVREPTADGETVLTAPVRDRGALQVVLADATERDESVADLLATHLGATLKRLDREDRLQTERERLEFINRALRHNLLNGLNVVTARADVLTDRVSGDLADHVAVIRNRASGMTSLVDRMRTFTDALVDSDSHELRPVALADVFADALAEARDTFPNAEFAVEGDVPDVSVTANSLLGTVFKQFLTNAVQHNDSATAKVWVSSDVAPDHVELRVRDNGSGVTADDPYAVFEKGVEGLSDPGKGFGLYLVKEVVDVYGGSVGVEDAPEGGAAFWVRLPRAD